MRDRDPTSEASDGRNGQTKPRALSRLKEEKAALTRATWGLINDVPATMRYVRLHRVFRLTLGLMIQVEKGSDYHGLAMSLRRKMIALRRIFPQLLRHPIGTRASLGEIVQRLVDEARAGDGRNTNHERGTPPYVQKVSGRRDDRLGRK